MHPLTRLARWVSNIWGDWQGHGRCMICGDSWSWKEDYIIELGSGQGVIPYCAECAKSKSLAEREAALMQLLARHD
jgi:hypothetical protein